MNTPICSFVKAYSEKQALRLHMPGHKGQGALGIESLDITEINGADSLYEANGIIAQSESNASELFGFPTYYSTEGSSQCIRAMLYLALLRAKQQGKKPVIAAAKNVHKTFLSAIALLDLDVMWLYPEDEQSYLSCSITARQLDSLFSASNELPCAVYLTSPDYLGNIQDIEGISAVCRSYGIMLLVDNAHGAYLKFMEPSMHPIDLGADMCCASAHKTLPVLTGGAYLQLSPVINAFIGSHVKNALALFGSTSPSYLIMQSLDAANLYLCSYYEKLNAFVDEVEKLKSALSEHGFILYGAEPLKLCIYAKAWGYTGQEMSLILEQAKIVSEFADPDYIVFLLTPEIGANGLRALRDALMAIPKRETITSKAPGFVKTEKLLSIRQAMLSCAELVPVSEAEGRVLAAASVGCPPAVPIVVCGERIDSHAIECFEYYGIEYCSVIEE